MYLNTSIWDWDGTKYIFQILTGNKQEMAGNKPEKSKS